MLWDDHLGSRCAWQPTLSVYSPSFWASLSQHRHGGFATLHHRHISGRLNSSRKLPHWHLKSVIPKIIFGALRRMVKYKGSKRYELLPLLGSNLWRIVLVRLVLYSVHAIEIWRNMTRERGGGKLFVERLSFPIRKTDSSSQEANVV